MCGIVATCGLPDGWERVPRMVGRLAHRGPDGEGMCFVGPHVLGHRRLAIVDPAAGSQPLITAGGDRVLVANGEVYNHESLRARVPAARFSTRSDNEILLHLVAASGTQALAGLRGMYAFAVAAPDGSFIAARDPVGIKPLFWWHDDDRAVFASELRAFDADLRPGVAPFPPGCWWSPRDGVRRFAEAIPDELRRPAPPAASEPSASVIAGVREHLVSAVRRRLMSDVPVGAFCSGGLDSSLVTAIAARLAGPLPTFAVGMPGAPDLLAARRVAAALGTDHHEVVLDQDRLMAAVPGVIRRLAAFDPALVRSAVANDVLAEEAARHVKVVLTGEGADECFAGYGYLASLPPEMLHAEQCHLIDDLHRLNLQRADHLTMAHGLEARVPFLDLDLLAFTMSLPPRWRAPRRGVAKHLLRTAFEGWLPDDLLWRSKQQFGDGSGVADVLAAKMAATVTPGDLAALRRQAPVPLRDAEEAAYYRFFAQVYGAGSADLVAQFATTSEADGTPDATRR